MKKELISIIMPVYNGASFLERSIKSVFGQTYKNWELIIIDDNSLDNSLKVIENYLLNDRIKLLKNKTNQGIAYSRNIGLKSASGSYIALLDQDDEWLPSKLEKQIKLFNEPGTDFGLVYTNTKVVLNDGKIIERKKSIQPGETIQENLVLLFLSNFISSLTVLIRKKCIKEVGNFNEDIKWGGDDYELWLRLATRYKFGFIDETLAIRYEHGGNFSASKKKIMAGTVSLAETFARKHPYLRKYVRKNKAKQFYRFGIESIKANNHTEGLYYILRSFFYDKIAFQLLIMTIKNKFNYN